MLSKKRAFVLVAGLLVLVLHATITLPGARNEQSPKKPDDATLIQEGVLTEKQKAHSKLFKKYEDVARGRKVRDLVDERGDVELVKELGDVLVPNSTSLQEYLTNLTCRADAVVVGTVQSKSSQINEEGTFIFTDYQLLVSEVVKSGSTAINPPQNITVTRAGGAVILNGHHVKAIDRREELLAVGGQYVLYLRLIPVTSSFQAFVDPASEDTFKVIGSKIKQTSKKAIPLGPRQAIDLDTFIVLARTAAQSRCAN
jgi:hypothetical protein